MKTKTLKAAFFFLLSLAASAGERLDPGLKQIGRLAVCEAKDVKSGGLLAH